MSSTLYSLSLQDCPILHKTSLDFSFITVNLLCVSNLQTNICVSTQWLYISDVPESVLNIYVIHNQLLSTIHYFVIKGAACISKRIILSIVQFLAQNSRPIKAFYFSYTKVKKKKKSPQTHNFSNALPHGHTPSFPILFFSWRHLSVYLTFSIVSLTEKASGCSLTRRRRGIDIQVGASCPYLPCPLVHHREWLKCLL